MRFALLLFCWLVAGRISAQTVTNVIDTFDTNSYPNNSITNKWSNWFGGAFVSLSLDPALDANTNAASGSLKIVANFPTNTDQFEVWNGISGFNPAVNGFQFTNFQCDVRFAAGSATNSGGNFGSLQFGVPTPSYGQDYFNGGIFIPASNTNWVHVSIALNPNTKTNLQSMIGLLIHIWGAGLVGPSTLWVDNIQFVGTTSSGTAVIDYSNTQQRIDGFGASSAWMSGTLSAHDADLFFSTNYGVGLSLLRTRITPDGTTWEGNIAQQAQARGARIWSTPWSPPAIYKSTNSVNGGSFVSSTANYQGYASQLAGYVQTMTNTYGIQLYALSVQNEPDWEAPWESCLWTSQQIHDFLPYLAAAMTARNVSATKIMIAEDANWKWDLTTNSMNDTTTSNLVGILAAHNYGSSAAPVTQFGTPCPKPLWETEHSIDGDESITNALRLAQEIHSFMTVAQANAYHYWWLISGGDGGIAGSNTYAPAKRLYAMGNYSRFIRPNFYRVGVTNTTTALVSAYKDSVSSNYVVVAANNSAFPVNQTFVLTNIPALTNLTPWFTSATQSLAVAASFGVANGTFSVKLPPFTVVSYMTQPLPPLQFTSARVVGTNLVFTGTNGGIVGNQFYTLTSTNAALPLANWTIIGTNQFNPGGGFSLTNPLTAAVVSQSFFILRLP
jgi:glucuronoarabinoxylan endo-1,4-beta-xylanase